MIRTLRTPLLLAAATAFFFFNDTATTEIYTLSLHDALPISSDEHETAGAAQVAIDRLLRRWQHDVESKDRKSTRLNSSHLGISHAVFCLKKKNKHRAAADMDAEASAQLTTWFELVRQGDLIS